MFNSQQLYFGSQHLLQPRVTLSRTEKANFVLLPKYMKFPGPPSRNAVNSETGTCDLCPEFIAVAEAIWAAATVERLSHNPRQHKPGRLIKTYSCRYEAPVKCRSARLVIQRTQTPPRVVGGGFQLNIHIHSLLCGKHEFSIRFSAPLAGNSPHYFSAYCGVYSQGCTGNRVHTRMMHFADLQAE